MQYRHWTNRKYRALIILLRVNIVHWRAIKIRAKISMLSLTGEGSLGSKSIFSIHPEKQMLLELSIDCPTRAKITSYRWHHIQQHHKCWILPLFRRTDLHKGYVVGKTTVYELLSKEKRVGPTVLCLHWFESSVETDGGFQFRPLTLHKQ